MINYVIYINCFSDVLQVFLIMIADIDITSFIIPGFV